MRDKIELSSVLSEIKINLKNQRILNILTNNKYDFENLKEAIEKYLNDEYIFKNDDLYNQVYLKAKELLRYTNNTHFTSDVHNFINASNYIIEYAKDLVHLSGSVNTIDTSKTTTALLENKKVEELENDNLKLLGQLQKLTDRFNKREEDFETVNTILEASSKLESDYINAKEAVLKDLNLQVSYTYWEDQVSAYTKKYWGYFIGSVFTAIILLCSIFIFLQTNPLVITSAVNSANTQLTVIKINNDVNSTKNDISNKNNFQLWEYGFLILLTTMGIWLIRILIKITLSNYHLSVDANERVIMIKTYLSLLKEGSGFETKDKKVMLDNIFRPTNFGIIKDETSVTIADVISSIKK